MKRLSKQAWFGKKREGVGLRPITWQGWMVTLIFVVMLVGLMLLTLINYQDVWIIEGISLLLIIVFIIVALLTSDRSQPIYIQDAHTGLPLVSKFNISKPN